MISLSLLSDLADLDDAAHSLGYDVCLLSADIDKVKSLIAAGFPLIHQRYNSFYLLWGFDESRSVVSEYAFEHVSHRLRWEAPKEAREILEFEEEGRGESQKRLLRIAQEAHHEHTIAFWENPALRYTGPLLAVVFPFEKGESLAATLSTSWNDLKRESDGYLATLISLAYLNSSDVVQAVEWAKVGSAKLTDPMPLYAAYLAEKLWVSRADAVKSALPLQEQFPVLTEIFAFFAEPENRAFLEQAHRQFEQDLLVKTLPWQIVRTHRYMLDRSKPEELSQRIQILRNVLTIDPGTYYASWLSLANLHEWAGDTVGMVEALAGHVSAYPIDDDAKLRLAYGHVLLEQYAEAQEVLDTIEVDGRIAYNADYPFCLGAIAEWEGNLQQALQYYAQAVEMRRYKPIYHLKYGRLLLQEGKAEDARKALEWAARIDAGEMIKQEAERLLSQM